MSFYEIIPITLLEGKQRDAGRCSQNATVCGGNKDRVAPLYLHTSGKRHEKLITKCPEHRNWKNIHFSLCISCAPLVFDHVFCICVLLRYWAPNTLILRKILPSKVVLFACQPAFPSHSLPVLLPGPSQTQSCLTKFTFPVPSVPLQNKVNPLSGK